MNKLLAFIVILAVAGGFYWYLVHKDSVDQSVNNAKNTVVNTGNTAVDTAIKTALSGVGSAAPIYYLQNKESYGMSATQNICNDPTSANSISSIVTTIQKYTGSVSCVVDSDFPSRSFTIVAPSLVNEGQFFCADQSGFAGLIPNVNDNASYKAGRKCK